MEINDHMLIIHALEDRAQVVSIWDYHSNTFLKEFSCGRGFRFGINGSNEMVSTSLDSVKWFHFEFDQKILDAFREHREQEQPDRGRRKIERNIDRHTLKLEQELVDDIG